MGFQVGCAKGCGAPVSITDEMIEEATKLGTPLIVSHDVCPKDQKILPAYRMTVKVEKVVREQVERPRADHECDDDESCACPPMFDEEITVLTTSGETVEAPTFADAFDPLTKAIAKQWDSISKFRNVIEED